MTKKAMKKALQRKIRNMLPLVEALDALALLDQFEKVYEIKKYAEKAKGIKKYWYYTVGYMVAIDGYIRDVRVNSTAGKALFGKYATFGTLTATLWRIKEAGPTAPNYEIAMQICAVLNNYDKKHC